jgi:hypothetical protein
MKDAQNPDHVSLNTIISRLREGKYQIPDFQRDFEWAPWDIRDLMRSVFMDYYIGSLLLWRGKPENFVALSCEPLYGFNGKSRPEAIVLDGQQRLTAMYYAFFAPERALPNRMGRAIYYIRVDRLRNEEWDEAFQYEWWSKRLNHRLQTPELQYADHFFPLSTLGTGGFELYDWINGYRGYWEEQARLAEETNDLQHATLSMQFADYARVFGNEIKETLEQYQISFIELDRELELDKICDIFTQINSKGVRLDTFDLINAMTRPHGLKLKDKWREAEPKLEFVDTDKMNVYILQVMSILLQNYCSPKYLYYLIPGERRLTVDPKTGQRVPDVLIRDIDDFERRWEQAVDALEGAIRLLRHPQEVGVISTKYLPYVSILPVFSALQAHLKSCPPDLRLSGQRKIKHWYWASVFLYRYSGSVESTSARDYQDVRAWIVNDAAVPPVILELESQFKKLDLRRETNTGSSVYKAIFNLLVLGGARDWYSGSAPQFDDLDDHHIIPKSWGFEHLEAKQIDTILNRTPLTSATNKHVISNRLPNAYLPEMIEANGEQVVAEIMASHFISREAIDILLRDPFTKDDFSRFVAERQRTIMRAIEDLLIKERLDLAPDLRELDGDIERIEIQLRRYIAARLEQDHDRLPQQLQDKLKDRVQTALRKDPSLDLEDYRALARLFEFADLRDLQEIIVSKANWPIFEADFGGKEATVIRFDQLANARNGIRHSRTVGEVIRKDAEAATIWFDQVLNRRQVPTR